VTSRITALWLLPAAAAVALVGGTAPTSAAASSNNPCASLPLPQCTSSLGPLRDVTAAWRQYQPALVQPIPVSDYYPSDAEDADPPVGAGHCGTETTHPPPPVPASTEVGALPPVFPGAPPGLHRPFPGSHYCLLRYLASDFEPLCAGCLRLLLDYGAIPAGNSTSPAAEGHWAGRFTPGSDFNPTISFNAHSPNMKNLCSDKFINPSASSDCVTLQGFDMHGLEMEGDTAIFHHYPLEGRYFNGPAYLAGDGASVPYHWVHGVYFDLDPKGAAAATVWYSAGYRAVGDTAPDTDQSYGCACELPGVGHQTFSADYTFRAAATSAPATPTALAATPGGMPVGQARVGLPGTGAVAPGAALLVLAGFGVAAALPLLARRRWPG
jgi:hypothetical protein